VFGDGGSGKSLVALYWACKLEQAGVRTAVFDWELAGEDHRERAERLFPGDVPAIRYVRCERPLIHESERLRRIVRDERLDYAILDSIAFACDGPPEAAEVASRYFQATRRLGPIGSLHVAHVSKAEGADRRPFGSAFWHNGCRASWFVKMAEPTPGSGAISIGLYNRKANLGALRAPIAYEIQFGEARTTIRRVEVADNADLASGLSVRLRMVHALRGGSLSAEELASQIDAEPETVRRTARRYRDQFATLPGGQLTIQPKRS
jgi:DNA-binding transcriptional ArsR family regulator